MLQLPEHSMEERTLNYIKPISQSVFQARIQKEK